MAFFKAIYLFWVKILNLIFGKFSWVPPFWLWPISKFFSLLCLFFKKRPKTAIISAFTLLLAGGAGGAGWIWYQNQPVPYMVSYEYNNPPLSKYEKDSVTTYPIEITFSDDVAPIDTDASSNITGVKITPEIKGNWKWTNHKKLQFKPLEDWSVNQKYTVTFDKIGLFANNVLLKDYSFYVETRPFSISIVNTKLYEDPQDPNLKKMITEVKASHPIDKQTFAKHVSFELAKGLNYQNKNNINPQIFYTEDELTASIHSSLLEIPLETSNINLKLSKGIASKLGGNKTDKELLTSVEVLGRYKLSFSNAKINFVRNDNNEPEPVLIFESSNPVSDSNIAEQVTAWVLPDIENSSKTWSIDQITESLLKRSEKISLNHIPSDGLENTAHAFKLDIQPGKQLYVRINGNVQSQAGYLSRHPKTLFNGLMPYYPKTLKFMSQGALLGLHGERTLGVMAQGVKGAQVEIARILPKQLHHLVDQLDGKFKKPDMSEREFDTLVERENIEFRLPDIAANKMQYNYVDIAPYLTSEDGRQGIFVVRISELGTNDQNTLGHVSSNRDIRFIVVTDIGIIAKRDSTGGHNVFVQSIETGLPIHNALVEVYGVNGLPIAQTYSDETGHAYFNELSELSREKRPLMYVVTNDKDQSFLPIHNDGRNLDFSRFSIGGVIENGESNKLQAFMFSDRGLYRPGETVHLGMIVRSNNWHGLFAGFPVEVTIYDPASREVATRNLNLSESGFESIDFETDTSMPAGTYTAQLGLNSVNRQNYSLGSVSFSVRDFEPDRMKVTNTLSQSTSKAWLHPDEVMASIKAMHLFGAPASNRRVTLTMRMEPAFIGFEKYRDYRFFIENTLEESHSEDLPEQKTDENGVANFNLDLKRFNATSYKLYTLAKVFEADGGRNVAASSSVLVSSADYMVGVKSEDNLDYVNKGSERRVNWLALNSNTKPIHVSGLTRELIEIRHVSVLVEEYDNTYRYASRKKEFVIENKPFTINDNGTIDTLDTNNPGEFIVKIKKGDAVLNQLNYSVAGNANLSRSLDRNSELTLKLNKTTYKPGEFIELNVRAPYVGAGLITIERDKVYAHQWFKTETTSSIQRIQLPSDLEGNAYINVQFVRSPQSDEIFMSPLSYGVAPFQIDLMNRTTSIKLKTPEVVMPDDRIDIEVNLNSPSHVLVWGVDEGILQVARYLQPRPLDFFFKKRALEVETSQILDLILPEFSKLFLAATGGDMELAFSKHLNPFKRKNKQPVAFWSGIVEMPAGKNMLEWQAPDYFNGKIHFFAIAVDKNRIGISQSFTESKSPIVLTPNVPAFVGTGDVVTVTMGAFSNLDEQDIVSLSIQPGDAWQIIGDEVQKFTIDPLKEVTANWQLKALNKLGAHDIRFEAVLKDGNRFIMTENVSIRPLSERRVQLTAKIFNENSLTINKNRELHRQLSQVQASFGYSPLAFVAGLNEYLDNYQYNCTEQTISKAMPFIMLHNADNDDAVEAVETTLSVLNQRINSSGGFGKWSASPDSDIFASLYAVDFMLEAYDRGFHVPKKHFTLTREFLQNIADETPYEGLAGLRLQAYAIYLLNRQAEIFDFKPSSNQLANLREHLDTAYENEWQKDTIAAYMAASYFLLQQHKDANALINKVEWSLLKNNNNKNNYFEQAIINDIDTITILARYFPDQLAKIPNELWQKISDNIQNNQYNSLTSALIIRAASIYEKKLTDNGEKIELAVKLSNEKTQKFSALGTPPRALLPFDLKSITLTKSRSDVPGFALLSEAGYDLHPRQEPRINGIEVFHDYIDLKGNKIEKVNIGDEFLVRVKIRSKDEDDIYDVAIVDLLPGGVELIYRQPNHSQTPEDTDEEDEDEDNEDREEIGLSSIGEPEHSNWQPDFIDPRDDRVVLYGSINKETQTFTYKVRAISAGTFTIPAIFAESMYDPQLNGEGATSKLIIE